MTTDPREALAERFVHDIALHPPQDAYIGEMLDGLRAGYIDFGLELIRTLPPGRDLSMALTDLETSCRCAIAAVVKNQDAILAKPADG